MKFLHLADLHIGKSVNGFSMLGEQRHVFQQIIEYIKTERPAAAVIAGDVYDRAVPGIEAVRAFDDFLTELACEDVAVLLVSGNHDSPERISYASRLLAEKRLFLCGAFDGVRKVTLTDEYGEVNFWLLPFVKPSSVRGFFGDREIESYGDAFTAALESADVDYAARNVLVSHQFFTKAGVAAVRSESEMNPVGGLDAIDAGCIGKFDYAALGHLHGSQKVGAEHIRYAGSILKYSFSEIRQTKSVMLVELNEKGSMKANALPLTPLHDMREIKGKIEKLIDAGVSSSSGREDYLRVILMDEDEIVDPMGKIRGVYPNIMALDFENSRTNIDISEINPDSEQAIQLSPFDLFSEFYLDVNGSVMSGEQLRLARELLDVEAAE
ncbi:MAG: exonuclease SbcCD subunit D [Synergistaceae bacterium]|jgi:exonuclease SbcD|nr:exonuclease SbcCD subunit D [Synergistaceae bacterium]